MGTGVGREMGTCESYEHTFEICFGFFSMNPDFYFN
jgi:hypothetical protein